MDTRNWVPLENSTTAILYVEEMKHMPQALRQVPWAMASTYVDFGSTRRGRRCQQERHRTLRMSLLEPGSILLIGIVCTPWCHSLEHVSVVTSSREAASWGAALLSWACVLRYQFTGGGAWMRRGCVHAPFGCTHADDYDAQRPAQADMRKISLHGSRAPLLGPLANWKASPLRVVAKRS